MKQTQDSTDIQAEQPFEDTDLDARTILEDYKTQVSVTKAGLTQQRFALKVLVSRAKPSSSSAEE
jgi:hypothetical protein